ncbi:hypothetical protein BASA81_001042 [Batrachochytrium salamandrivorans]|nr:hypothetical protein BASA81_001042 [Batrachochytrium salamandrivorans]
MGLIEYVAGLFGQDASVFFNTDMQDYDSFFDWFVTIRNPFNKENGHFYWEPAFFANEVEIYILAALTFAHAYRHGGRYLYMWLAILWHGFTVELVSYWVEPIDNFWHAQSTFVFFGKREPMQIVLLYPGYLYMAAMVTKRMNVSELTQATIMALMVLMIDFPYDIMGIKLLFWTWHDTDSNLYWRNYWVPITSYYFHATFASSFSLIYSYSCRYFIGISGLYSADERERHFSFGKKSLTLPWQEFKACAMAGLFSMPIGILQFVPLFHYFQDVWHVQPEVTTITLGAIYLCIAFYGVNHARAHNLLEQGQREQFKGNRQFGKGKWYYDEIVLAVLVHFTFYCLLVVFANPNTYQVYGLHQELGSLDPHHLLACQQNRSVTYPYPLTPAAVPSFLQSTLFQNVTVTKRPYLCPDLSMFDEGYFNFNCSKAQNQVLNPGDKFYWICGKDWTNNGETSHVEYIFVVFACSFVALHVMIQPLIYPRTLFEQFFVLREFPKYWKYDKPNAETRGGEIVDMRINPKTGGEDFLLKGSTRRWVSRKSFEANGAEGQIYKERGGLYGQLYDTQGRANWDRARTFVGWKHAQDRIDLKRPVGPRISYVNGFPQAVEEEEGKED